MVITGIGVVSPVGTGVQKFWNSLIEGKSGIGYISHFDASEFDCRIAGNVTDFDPLQYFSTKEARNLAKFVQYACVASDEAVASAKLDLTSIDLDRFGILIGSGIGSIETLEAEHQKFIERGPSRISPHFIPKIIINEA
ncbi:MAG: beta-ketoacyl-[acyl-carrier-protein] synthase II, partial [Candidatus Omnitrophica bacterium]|nr:beta-ketoacyl-[acyl-carrier-protein] synthase II [Candidatus Omnitrophota bacterium]